VRRERVVTSYTHKSDVVRQELRIGNKVFPCRKCPDPRPGNYYISAVLDDRFALVSGPYRTHQEALNLVGRAEAIASESDPRAVWASFGTVRMKDKYEKSAALQRWGYDLKLEKRNEKMLAACQR
jgi:hypothetical protein